MFIAASVAIALAVLSPVSGQQAHQHDSSEKLGTVRFANSCSAAVQPTFARAMALLHSFEFGPAIAELRLHRGGGPGLRDRVLGHRRQQVGKSVRSWGEAS